MIEAHDTHDIGFIYFTTQTQTEISQIKKGYEMVPHLATLSHAALAEFENTLIQAMPSIERWFRMAWQEHTPLFNSAVEMCHSGFKLAPVNMTLYPSHFHQLSCDVNPLAVQAAMAAIEKYCPDAKNLLIVVNAKPQDDKYWSSVERQVQIFRQIGLHVKLGVLPNEEVRQVENQDGVSLKLERLQKSSNGRRIVLHQFDPCTILCNYDLSQGIPPILENCHEQTLLPPLHAAWPMRKISNYLACYDDVVKKFTKHIDIDPWVINPFHARCEKVDWQKKSDRDRLAEMVADILAKTKKKYKSKKMKLTPFVLLRQNTASHTDTMLSLQNTDRIYELSEADLKKISIGKDGSLIQDYIVQEGVYSQEEMHGAPASNIVYMIDRFVVGGFYRAHTDTGLKFQSMGLSQEQTAVDSVSLNRFYPYGVVARLAMLAAAIELEETDPNPDIY